MKENLPEDPLIAVTSDLISKLGINILHPSVAETPARMARMFRELLTPKEFSFTLFDSDGYDEMIVVRRIPFVSLCEHHLLPFFGTVDIGYIPIANIAGLSKFPRLVEFFSRRAQVQERFTKQIADFMLERLAPQGLGVVVSARHMCMEIRGVRAPGVETITTSLHGIFHEHKVKDEFLRSIK